MIDIAHALTVDGWMTREELEYLAGLAEKSKCILEVGSWKGRSTSALAMNTKGIVVAVDTWTGSEEHQKELNGQPTDALFRMFESNTAHYDNVWPLRLSSLFAARLLSRGPVRFDLIFIDASHDYESVKADILAWRPLLIPGGTLSGHDFVWRESHPFKGVRRAVDELVPRYRVVHNTSIWTTEGV